MRPTRSTRALGAIIRDLMQTRDGATYFAEKVWGVSLRYDLGGEHPLVGRSAPDFEFIDGTRLGDLLKSGGGLLLDFDARAPLEALAVRWRGRLAYVSGDAKDRLGFSALLVRPDGVVAWAADGDPDLEDCVAMVGCSPSMTLRNVRFGYWSYDRARRDRPIPQRQDRLARRVPRAVGSTRERRICLEIAEWVAQIG